MLIKFPKHRLTNACCAQMSMFMTIFLRGDLMKKFFLTLFLTVVMFVLLTHGEPLWSKLNFLDDPQLHTVQKGEYLSKLAKQHYGDAQRWRELALVNRVPNPDHLQAGEEILLPSVAVISELHRSRTLTRVNALVGDQKALAVQTTGESSRGVATEMHKATNGTRTDVPAEAPAERIEEEGKLTESKTSDDFIPIPGTATENSGFPWFWLAIGLIVVAGVSGFVWYRRKQAREAASESEAMRTNHPLDKYRQSRPPFSSAERPTERATV
jgi:hypothetical protein